MFIRVVNIGIAIDQPVRALFEAKNVAIKVKAELSINNRPETEHNV